MDIVSVLESILFVASKPLTILKIAGSLNMENDAVETALNQLEQKYVGISGVHIIRSGDSVQMVTNQRNSEIVEKFTKSEVMGELTRPQLETLTVIAYRGPITRPELEQIRGVNCAIILRNLMIRGLIEESDTKDSVLPVYNLSIAAMRHLAIGSVEGLPDYENLHKHEHIVQALENEE